MGSVSVPSKKVAAIMAAVLRHSAEERAAEPILPALPGGAPSVRAPTPVPPLWAWAGRQSFMLERVACQRRSLKSW